MNYVEMFVVFIWLQKANDTERKYKLLVSKMNMHKINISSLLADELQQLLHFDIHMFYPDVTLRLFPVALILRSAAMHMLILLFIYY